MSYKPRVVKDRNLYPHVYSPIPYSTNETEKIVIPPSHWVQRILNLRVRGATIDFSLDGRPYLYPVYDNGYRRIVMLTGRQVEKSTTLAAKLFGWMTKIPNFKAIYAGPDDNTIKTFSEARLYDFIDSSPALHDFYMKGPGVIRNIGTIKMSNGAACYLKNAARQGSNFRGLSVEAFLVDEMQGMDEEVMPVGRECLSHGKLQIEMYCGTPLTMHNFAEKQWKRSTQNEWLIPCPNCNGALSTPGSPNGRHQYYINIGIPNITPSGLICDKCGTIVHQSTGQWVRMQPHKLTEGFRIPQPIGEWVNLERVYIEKLLEYPMAQFKNEVLGISCDSAALFLTEEELYAKCNYGLHLLSADDGELSDEARQFLAGKTVVGGVDWGHANVEDGGTTTLVLFAIDRQYGHIDMIYGRIYPHTMGKLKQTAHIIRMLKLFNVSLVCCDWGASGSRNEEIAEAIGSRHVTQIQYSGGNPYVKYQHETSIFRVGKTPAMSTFYADFTKRGMVHLVVKEEFEPRFSEQMLGAGKEVDHQGNLRYVKMDGNDDFLQAVIYANMARRLVQEDHLVDNIPLAEERIVYAEDVEKEDWDGTQPNYANVPDW